MTTLLKEVYNLYKIYTKLNIALKNSVIVNEPYCREIKAMILADGCIAIKFAQWIISRLRSEPGEHIEYIVNYFDDIFDNCPFHTMEYTNQIFDKYSHYSLSEIVQPGSLKEVASGSVGQIYRATLLHPYIVCPQCDTVLMHYEAGMYNSNADNTSNSTVPLIPVPPSLKLSHTSLHSKERYDNETFEVALGCKRILDKDVRSKSALDPTVALHGACDSMSVQTVCDKCNGLGRPIYDVAIKVKHPNVNEQVRAKVKLFRLLTILQNIKWVKNMLNLHMDMNDFIDNLTKQIDFQNEYDNNHKFRANFKGNKLIQFPLALDANCDILISEFIETQSFDSIPEYTQYKQCLNYACMVSQMILVDNFVHADLHHKNWQIKQLTDALGQPISNEYKLVVFDTGICFDSVELETNQIIWESFESGDVDKIMEIMDKVIIGTYTENIKKHIKPMLENYRNTTLNISHIMHEINGILVQYNCRMSTLCLNIILLLCLIDTTLKKHNLIGATQAIPIDDQSPVRKHQNILRAKNLDLIAYLRSNPACYSDVLTYFEDKQKRLARTYSDDNITLFGNGLGSGMIFDIPLD
jgi:predicted unusual protein kinase regulating ubiquinone biosynthesis (AarF/ABC1/UbiB family)